MSPAVKTAIAGAGLVVGLVATVQVPVVRILFGPTADPGWAFTLPSATTLVVLAVVAVAVARRPPQ